MAPSHSGTGSGHGHGDAATPHGRRPSPGIAPALNPGDKGRAAVPSIDSADLLRGCNEVHILHNGETYRLTVTRSGKLILHK